jgi:synaptobrevin family protein YKT6
LVLERTDVGQRQTIDEKGNWTVPCAGTLTGRNLLNRYLDFTAYVLRSQMHPDLAGVTVTDKEYPSRAAFCVLAKVLDDCTRQFPAGQWQSSTPLDWPELSQMLIQYQNPERALDKMARVQAELDATTEIMHKNIDQVLRRGENLDILMSKTQELDMATKVFLKSAKKANRRCCSIQ